jgi:hypothetical protein
VLSRSDLEALSSHELHDLAMRRALHHGDFGFLWELLREIPAAEAIEGNPARTGADMYRISALITDALGSGEGQTADALRPLYIDYLEKHGELRLAVRGLKPVANPVFGRQAGTVRRPELAPQAADVHVDGAGRGVRGLAPHPVEQVSPAEDLSRVRAQEGQQLEFLVREDDLLPVPRRGFFPSLSPPAGGRDAILGPTGVASLGTR